MDLTKLVEDQYLKLEIGNGKMAFDAKLEGELTNNHPRHLKQLLATIAVLNRTYGRSVEVSSSYGQEDVSFKDGMIIIEVIRRA
ncbi:hypothetical protein A3K34_04810 [candidate division WWE3 bacterium RIFOXYC1_FULL_40_10]|uniref:Uncharacterized protein n=1 Tax=candidate division WWE3 bacterium RIFOXYA2_FULL_46_9 TaxID=1802636 RepID=A0A1F4W291_UNCKA|nr:MAG: hypothetical protein A3K58_04810 [candidate division WWE3 bacterium RIFOXYB1_FULL_40_22]OGC62159.1 MAG: hypothetical protein A3K37_04810 [candidate division WWE3 bacterium RIFOXYA1_FULL_40_11]OGC63173.1 MAG: hypothetical protein A2264_00560 [candidate division WWE3 bacterium RIFOXYA2_FULL_46_9]OGC65253.1 MAG: hypothetical protein A2326_04195 [candidate division WWE3 bacterium RIFOXYB2_FULL_41_6]OGC66542.1 MAG: hypothetical protein A3K34_04810 [candidate division WWE3 bacterium RIFOXYC1_